MRRAVARAARRAGALAELQARYQLRLHARRLLEAGRAADDIARELEGEP